MPVCDKTSGLLGDVGESVETWLIMVIRGGVDGRSAGEDQMGLRLTR